ncbi:MAG: hypothetical protein HFG52_03690 [Lachnospiraceae bacterium]|nr:hypothetical protein [Lachnospiraceae bacterium]
MSRTVRKQLFSMIDLMEKANKILEKNLFKNRFNEQEIIGLLSDCQESAISVGNMIEALIGEGTETVAELERYCENLFQMSQSLNNPPARREILGHLGKQIKKIRRFLGNDMPDKLEVVFLPYKTSMWDSLESIWIAAEEDAGADAYVIPIPYYDKNPDGTFRQEHYEGEEFPKYVDVTDYRDYDFELRQPDIVFIHNPYDGGNYVTSVAPFFYSKNLKQYTEKLVYVPYFVLDGDGIEESYVLTAGVLNADYVVVQTEKEKQDYIKHIKEAYPDFSFNEDKFLPLGSPKFDKVCSMNREHENVPLEWREKAEGKKVILYNTSVTSLLKSNEEYLAKMRRVFDLFKEREDTILLWRPHPLMESTLASMRPNLYGEYMELKQQFVKEQYGIYDDSPDMYPAIGLSDAYYGDWSSLVWLYQKTGKMIMIQDVEVE